jgi:hypothetical protein
MPRSGKALPWSDSTAGGIRFRESFYIAGSDAEFVAEPDPGSLPEAVRLAVHYLVSYWADREEYRELPSSLLMHCRSVPTWVSARRFLIDTGSSGETLLPC